MERLKGTLRAIGRYLERLGTSAPLGADIAQEDTAVTPFGPGVPPVEVSYRPRDLGQLLDTEPLPE